jgi:hypothetical protein
VPLSRKIQPSLSPTNKPKERKKIIMASKAATKEGSEESNLRKDRSQDSTV